jgi:hypothetical protein
MVSKEQLHVINELGGNVNVAICAIPGSGKSTTIYSIAKAYSALPILVLTYSSRLKDESRRKVNEQKLDNVDIQSYHSFYNTYFDGKQCHDDFDLKDIIDSLGGNINSDSKISSDRSSKRFGYKIIIVDEIQDMNGLYYEAVLNIMKMNTTPYKMVILGDDMQSIYGYKGASPKYLLEASKYFVNDYKWVNCKLSVSFRLPKYVANFINKCYLGDNRINSVGGNLPGGIEGRYTQEEKNSLEFRYFKYGETYMIANAIIDMVTSGKYLASDIFILSNTIKRSPSSRYPNPINMIVNTISKKGIDVYMSLSDNGTIDLEGIKKKVVVSTYHQAKGLERKIVFVLGLDTFIPTKLRYNNLEGAKECVYVALTRVIHKMYIYISKEIPYIFNNMDTYFDNPIILKGSYINLFKLDEKKYGGSDIGGDNSDAYVTAITDHLPFELLYTINNDIKDDRNLTTIIDSKQINLKSKVVDRVNYETIDDINGNFCTMLCERFYGRTDRKTYIEDNIDKTYHCTNVYSSKHHIENIRKIRNNNIIKYYVICCHLNYAITSGLWYRYYQIRDKNHVSKDNVINIVNNAKGLFKVFGSQPSDLKYEEYVEFKYLRPNNTKVLTLKGRVDCVDHKRKIIYEFKYVAKFRLEHYIQCILYGLMYGKMYKVVLYNIRYGTYEIIGNINKWESIINMVLATKNL